LEDDLKKNWKTRQKKKGNNVEKIKKINGRQPKKKEKRKTTSKKEEKGR
jgi:hypothetical protein